MTTCKHCGRPTDTRRVWSEDFQKWRCCWQNHWDIQAALEYDPASMQEASELQELNDERQRFEDPPHGFK